MGLVVRRLVGRVMLEAAGSLESLGICIVNILDAGSLMFECIYNDQCIDLGQI